MDIKNLSIEDSKKLCKQLKFYRDLSKKVGKKSKTIFKKIINNTHSFEVEYSQDLEKEYILSKSGEIYKNIFGIIVNQDEIKLIKKDNLIGGIKVYFDDNVIDISFLKIFNQLKNT